MIKAVIFDMDGTLFDTESLHLFGWEELVRTGVLSGSFLDIFPSVCGKDRRQMTDVLPPYLKSGVSVPLAYQLRDGYWMEKLNREGLPLKPGVPQVPLRLKEMGYRVALASASLKSMVDDLLKRAGMEHLFDTVVTGNDVKNGKPDPEIYLHTMKVMGVLPSETLAVEDSHNGIRSAVGSGAKVIAVPDLIPLTDELRADLFHECETLWEIPPLLEHPDLSFKG